MDVLKKFMALMQVLAIANFGHVATIAHAHEHTENYHAHIFLLEDFEHDLVATHHKPGKNDTEMDSPLPDQGQSDVHSHSVPQFNPPDQTVIPAIAVSLIRIDRPDRHDTVRTHRDPPPFKPPRLLL